MIKAEIKGKEYEIPTSWYDVPYKKAVELIRLDDADLMLCHLIGLELEELHALSGTSVATLFNCVKFLNDVEIMNDETPEERFAGFDYGSQPYGTTEGVKQIMNNNKDKTFLDLAPQVIKKLTDVDISDEPFAKVVGSVGFFLKQWIHFTADSMNLTGMITQTNNNAPVSDDLKGSEVLRLM